MKIPRNLSGKELIKILEKLGYEITRQKGSHVRLTDAKSGLHLTIPLHSPLKLGTLSSILNDAAEQLNIPKEEILK
ncbi:type II toxin-antitoxin system HicA family toxin [Pedobacter frigiditerrae]|uniref:type II toxin-antitoxin system HicA family toxin n=1 Tax=Pedobacter frigiditerrae TaxID=2530452 RepID=UPI0029306F85|nr:type II toxin-antitoxin system HicA family toxin [Pedobacter frigiditerrae]